jgi:hypothetical protein
LRWQGRWSVRHLVGGAAVGLVAPPSLTRFVAQVWAEGCRWCGCRRLSAVCCVCFCLLAASRGGELVEDSRGPLGVIPGCLADHGERLELLGHLLHEPHGEAGPELVLCLQLCGACFVQGHLQEQLPREGDAGPVQAAPCGKNQGLKLTAMPGAHLFVKGPFVGVRSLQEVVRR